MISTIFSFTVNKELTFHNIGDFRCTDQKAGLLKILRFRKTMIFSGDKRRFLWFSGLDYEKVSMFLCKIFEFFEKSGKFYREIEQR